MLQNFVKKITQPILLNSNSCLMIYSEHFLEHIEYPDPKLDSKEREIGSLYIEAVKSKI